jgi:Lrp/AsnC family leucine-responsive transcriptional regulator
VLDQAPPVSASRQLRQQLAQQVSTAWGVAAVREQYPATVDDVDRSILAVLDKEGRISNAELAERVGLSPSPCLRRVRRLERTGVIRGYRAVIDPAAIGRSLRVLVGVRLVRHARSDVVAFERTVIELPDVRCAYHVTGDYDYILQVEVADLPAYEAFHANRLANLPSVAAVTSYVTMKTLSPATH